MIKYVCKLHTSQHLSVDAIVYAFECGNDLVTHHQDIPHNVPLQRRGGRHGGEVELVRGQRGAEADQRAHGHQRGGGHQQGHEARQRVGHRAQPHRQRVRQVPCNKQH